MSSEQNEAKAGADRPAGMPALGQPALGQPAPGRVAFGGPLPGSSNPWKEADGRTVFRRVGPMVLWWIWVAFILFNLIQIVITEHGYFSIELAAGLLTATGVAYATTLRPRVIATSDGLEVQNPLRDHIIRWGALNGVYLGDAVELSCTRPAPRKQKTVYCWALYSGRRSRQKSQQLGVRSWSRASARTAAATEPPVRDTAQLMAAELGRRSTEAREAGAVAATLESRWAWLPIAFICIPAAALLALLLAK
ncbi:MAG TPA: PH domain-containing protein [Streptosporangiaceae bacterium]|nr:PH domain-containing protein [Streptosporangiaceae bacterium]